MALFAPAEPVNAADFEQHGVLTTDANEAFSNLSEDSNTAERSDAAETAARVVGWLNEFGALDAFSAPSEYQHESARTDRHRWGSNIARQWLVMETCAEARDQVASTLEVGVSDAELLSQPSGAFAEAAICAFASRFGNVKIEATPMEAQLIIDRVAPGNTGTAHCVELAHHDLTLRATGYVDRETEFELTEPDAEVNLGPFALAAETVSQVEPAKRSSLTPSNALLATGGVVGVSGLVLTVAGQRHQRLSDNPGDARKVAHPEREQRIVDHYRIAGATCPVAAAASVTREILMRPTRVPSTRASILAGPNLAALSVQVR